MPIDNWADLGLALARGDAALWLGPDWQVPSKPEDLPRMAAVAWLGVWSESKNARFQSALEEGARKRGDARLVIEVPDHVEDKLGPGYKLSEICPYFYLRGKEGVEETLTERKRARSREDKIEELGQLGPGVLVVLGYASADALLPTLKGEIAEDALELRGLFIAGLPEPEFQRLRAALAPELAARVWGTPTSLVEVLAEIEQRRHEALQGPVVQVGSGRVDLRPLLQTVPPIDQEFIILTTSDVRDPEPEEDTESLLHDLLAGRPPWRALAHRGVAWDRPTPHRELVRSALQQFSRGDALVHCLDLPAEAGSGLTVLLQQIAFDAARAGHPSLLHRANESGLNYHLLRQFLTDLYQAPGVSKENLQVPALLIFDAPSVEADVQESLHDLPSKLVRDGRRVLLIRALPVEGSTARPTSTAWRRQAHVTSDRLPPLSAELSQTEQEDLTRWAASGQRQGRSLTSPEALDLIANWDAKRYELPLLICLDAILTEDLRSAAGFGQHLVNKVAKVLPPPLRGKELERWLQENLGHGEHGMVPPTADEVAAVIVTLAALSCLRMKVPQTVLADLASVPRARIRSTVACLEASNLVAITLPLIARATPSANTPQAPVAYYTSRQTIALRHPGYGRLILEWLASVNGAGHRTLLGGGGLTEAVVRQVPGSGRLGPYPLRLLEPLVRRLNRPGDRDHVQFVGDFSVRYLRLAKKQNRTPLSNWQWQNTSLLLEALGWLDEQVVRQSATSLHTRGITRYKTCFPGLPLADVREHYLEAEADFRLAIERAHDTKEEHPGNIITSLGLLYLGWAQREREEHGLTREWQEVDRKTEQTLRDALRERFDNPYAAFGLARYLLTRCGDRDRQLTEEARARDLAEAIDLLQYEPEAYFEDEWNELRREAVERLEGKDAERLIIALKRDGNELGFALAALRHLHGRIPTEPTQEEQEVRELQQAADVLRAAEGVSPRRPSNMADLLRYAVFSADPERFARPAYQVRFDLLRRLAGTTYLDQPLWLFDYALLAFQTRHYREAADAFARLRRGHRFFEVSRDRSRFWSRSPDTVEPQPAMLRIVSAQVGDEQGWGRIEQPLGYPEPVPFSVRAFVNRNKNTRVGTTATCYVRLRPSGPYAEPDVR